MRFFRRVTGACALCASSLLLSHCSSSSSGGGQPTATGEDGGAEGASSVPDGASPEASPSSTDASSADAPADARMDAAPSGPPVWSKSPTPLPFPPFAIHGSSPQDVWVLGRTTTDGGTLQALAARFDGTSWTAVPMPGLHDPRAIFAGGTMGTFVATAYVGSVYRWDGTSWNMVFQPSVSDVYAFGGTSGSDLWLGTQWNFCDGPLYRFDGTVWAQVPIQNNMDGVDAILAVSPGNVLAAFSSAIASGDSTGTFKTVDAVAGVSRLVGASPDDVWAMGLSGGASLAEPLLHYDGTSWQTAQAPGSGGETFSDGACVAKGDCWLIGSTSGQLYHTENGTLVAQGTKPGAPPQVSLVWALGKDDLIALNGADVYRYAPGP